MESETASSTDEQVAGSSNDTRGKHRVLAQLKHLEQELKCLEDELRELEESENASTISAQLLARIESTSDPLLPIISAPINTTWDRWFEGPQDSHRCRFNETIYVD